MEPENKKESNCIHDKPSLSYFSGKLKKGECLLGCGRESKSYVQCNCGKKYCMICYEMSFPEEKAKYGLMRKTSCLHERSNLSFKLGYFDAKECRKKCGRSSQGYLVCLCGVKHCILCYEDYHPEDKGKYLSKSPPRVYKIITFKITLITKYNIIGR